MAPFAKTINPRLFQLSGKRASGKGRLKKLGRFMFYLPLTMLVFAFPTVASQYLLKHSYLEIKSVDIVGVGRISSSLLHAELKPYLSGNIFTCDIKRASELLKKNPWISYASIRRRFPDVIEVSITERYPSAVVRLDRPYLIDWQGYLLEPTSKTEGKIVIAGLDGVAIPGERIEDRRLNDAYTLIDIFSKDTVFSDPVTYVDFSDPDRVEAHTAGGILLKFTPDSDEWETKFLEYLTVRKILSDGGTYFKSIDLSFKNQAVVVRGENYLPEKITDRKEG